MLQTELSMQKQKEGSEAKHTGSDIGKYDLHYRQIYPKSHTIIQKHSGMQQHSSTAHRAASFRKGQMQRHHAKEHNEDEQEPGRQKTILGCKEKEV